MSVRSVLRWRVGLVVLAASLTTATRTIHKLALTSPEGGSAADSPMACVWRESIAHVAAHLDSVCEPREAAPQSFVAYDLEPTLPLPRSMPRLTPRERLRWLAFQLE